MEKYSWIKNYYWRIRKIEVIWTQSHYFHCSPFKGCNFCYEAHKEYSLFDKFIYISRIIYKKLRNKNPL